MNEGGEIIEETQKRSAHDEFEDLFLLEQKYGKHMKPELMDDFNY